MAALPFDKPPFRASVHLQRFMKQHSHLLVMAQNCRLEENAADHHWPLWCYLPMAVWLNLLEQEAALTATKSARTKTIKNSDQVVNEVARAATLGAWHVSQGIYRFDSTLYEALLSTPFQKQLSLDLFQTLPQWCVYIETPGLNLFDLALKGLWAHLEYDLSTGAPELRLLLDTESKLTIVPVELGNWNFSQAMSRLIARNRPNAEVSLSANTNQPQALTLLSENIVPLLSLILYLCNYHNEIVAVPNPSDTTVETVNSNEINTAPDDSPRLKPKLWLVGEQQGAQLRAHYHARELNHFTPVEKADVARQAHWRRIKTSAKEAGSSARLRWIAPTNNF